MGKGKVLSKLEWHKKRTNHLMNTGIDIGPWKPPVKTEKKNKTKK